MAERSPAPKDGIQIYNGNRFRAIRGELMMPGATFEDHETTEAAHQQYLAEAAAKKSAANTPGPTETTVSNGASENTSGHPKWFLAVLEKATASGTVAPDRLEGESEAAYKARVTG